MTSIPATCCAVVLSNFGDASQLRLNIIPTPRLRQPDEMLVRIKATGVNPIEWKMREGFAGIHMLGHRVFGNPMILGLDFAGDVVEVGPAATTFQVGDAVFGALPWGGAYSEYVVVRPSDPRIAVAHIPAGLSYEAVGAAPFTALVAYAGLVSYGGLPVPQISDAPSSEPRVLVVGASGGVGHLAVQMAKRALNASLVVGVCSSRNSAFAHQCGADVVIEHDKTSMGDIVRSHPHWAHSFDLLFDTIGIDDYYITLAPRLLKPTGRFVSAALPPSRPNKAGEDVGVLDGLNLVVRLGWRHLGGRYKFVLGLFGGLPTKEGFCNIVRWMDEGKLRASEWKRFDLAHIRDAHQASQTGTVVGKIVVTVPA